MASDTHNTAKEKSHATVANLNFCVFIFLLQRFSGSIFIAHHKETLLMTQRQTKLFALPAARLLLRRVACRHVLNGRQLSTLPAALARLRRITSAFARPPPRSAPGHA